MLVIPAIDMIGGKCVRLTAGDYNQKTTYADDPVQVAIEFQKSGAKWLHVVDLDAAKEESSKNIPIIKKIVDELDIPIQLGGGIRSLEKVEGLAGLGVRRLIIGTLALENPLLLAQILQKYSDKIAVALDSKNGRLMTRGWLDGSGADLIETAKNLESAGVKRFIYTDTVKDGSLGEPNYAEIESLVKHVSVPIIAGGGVSTLDAIKKLSSIGVEGVILGKALYENKLDFKEANNVG